jgi:hypothetical protein
MNNLPKLEWNLLQSLSVAGVALSLFSHLGLFVLGKEVHNFERVYYVWAVVFLAGCLVQWLNAKGYIDFSVDEHHHDHTH